MSDFLQSMAASSAQRALLARRQQSWAALEARIATCAASAALRLSPLGFDVIAEMKLRSPAAGALGTVEDNWQARIAAYARGGAAAVSVLTEPSRFDGSLEHLCAAARILAPLGVPTMRKDFLVDPYQVLEARAAGAGGVLLIVRMLSAAQLEELLQAARQQGLFVLLEAFDASDLERAAPFANAATPAPVLLGVNCRDLTSLQVDVARFAALAPHLPARCTTVAESGVATPADAQRMRALGYRAALIGTALMQQADPAHRLREILTAARTSAA